VNNKVLQNETRALSAESYFDYSLVGDRGNSSQATAEHFDEQTGVIFFTQVNRDGVTCWNTRKPLTPETCTVVDSDQSTLIFPNDLKVDSNGTLWVISDKMPIFLYGELDHDVVNYRVFRGNTKTLIEGTPCDN
jgi:Major royal jelly protein